MLYLHSYTYRGQSIERAARKSRVYGYDGLELHVGHFDRNNPQESIRHAANAAHHAGTRIGVVDFAGDLIADDPEERVAAENGVAEIIRSAAAIRAQGVNGCVGQLIGADPSRFGENGSRLARPEHYERAADACRRLGQLAGEFGLWLSLEIHMNTPHDSAATTSTLLEMIDLPNVVANLDPGNMYATPHAEPIAEAVDILGKRLGYVHLKNCRNIAGKYDYSWPLDRGEIDYDVGLHTILNGGFKEPFCLEYCGLGDPSVVARRDAQYFRELLEAP